MNAMSTVLEFSEMRIRNASFCAVASFAALFSRLLVLPSKVNHSPLHQK